MNLNNNRKMKKLGSRDESGISQQSILSAMDRFVLAVDNMNETVMVPSRLMDMTVIGGTSATTTLVSPPPPPPIIDQADLFGFFTMLNSVKNELIWGPGTNNKLPVNRTTTNISSGGGGGIGVPSRRNSVVSSMSLSDSEAETESCSESDSSLEYDSEVHSSAAARNFRHHLNGLYQALQQLTDSADVLTERYQEEVGGTS